ncbi:MAG: hypothetical protein V4696_05120 [Pseudomonadota bacterium]
MTEQEEFEFRLRFEREQAAAPKKAEKPSRGMFGAIQDAGAGLVRGAGSIGATLLDNAGEPGSMLHKALYRPGRRAAMDEAFQSMGVDTDSLAYGGGKLTAEVGSTLGVGGVLGSLAGAGKFANALRTSGMSTGAPAATNALGRVADMGVRIGAGGVVGGASAGLVDPDFAAPGAAIGAALPPVIRGSGAVGNALGRAIRGPEQSAATAAGVATAREAGYVIPPTQARPSLMNRVLEGFSGKITTAQNASAKNQAVTNRLAAESIGLPAETSITPEVLAQVRKQAGQAYEAIGGAGTITPGPGYAAALDKIAAPHLKAAQGFPNAKASPVLEVVESLRSPNFDAAAAVAKIKELRSAADDGFRTGNTDVGRASKAAAKALEDAIEAHLGQTGDTATLEAFRAARELIAKTYSVEKALNPTTGTVDARKLAGQLARGKPLSGGLKDAADFAGRFPRAAQATESMGSLPQTSPLDWHALGATSLATGNPLVMAGVAARPAARSMVLSPMVQNRLIQRGPNALQQLLENPALLQLGYRAAPVALADR